MIYFASDHAGFELKEHLKKFLIDEGYKITDLGANKFDAADDYPDFVIPAAKAVAKSSEQDKGIIIGASGQGEAMAANKIKNIRAVVYYGGSVKIIRLSREHNNANVLSLGARFVSKSRARQAVKLWLNTDFSNAKRHVRRLVKLKI